jgi:hypothetical protein
MNDDRNYTGFWVKEAITTIACTLVAASSLSACNDSNNTPLQVAGTTPTPAAVAEGFSLNSLLNSLEGAKREAHEAVGPHADAVQSRTKEEVEKLFRWEYRVVETPQEQGAAELETLLSTLGAEGWECFNIQPQSSGNTRITCKRKPKSALSYLKYIPGL